MCMACLDEITRIYMTHTQFSCTNSRSSPATARIVKGFQSPSFVMSKDFTFVYKERWSSCTRLMGLKNSIMIPTVRGRESERTMRRVRSIIDSCRGEETDMISITNLLRKQASISGKRSDVKRSLVIKKSRAGSEFPSASHSFRDLYSFVITETNRFFWPMGSLKFYQLRINKWMANCVLFNHRRWRRPNSTTTTSLHLRGKRAVSDSKK